MKEIILSVFVPCFNEEKNIASTLDNIKNSIKNIDYEILIADDASTDKSVEIIKKYKSINQNLNIKIFLNEKNQGLGFNYFATAHKALGKYYMWISGDAVEPPSTIKKIVGNLGKADMVLTHLGKNDIRTFTRRIVSRIFVIILNIITFNNIKYYNGPSLHLLENVKLHRTNTSGYGYQAELITTLLMHKTTYIELEVENTARQWGETKAFKFHNFLSVSKSLVSIFFNQIRYIIEKILK